MNETIYILLPVHNRREITLRFVESLLGQTYEKYHLILIDDGSTDGTEQMVRERVKKLTVIKGTGDWWWAGALQQGLNILKSQGMSPSDIVLIINDDTEFDDNFLETGVALLKGKARTLLLAHCYDRATRKFDNAGIHLNWRHFKIEHAGTQERINCLSTRGLFMLAADLFEIGGFYPRLLPHYLSDYEFTHRAFNMGMKLITDPKLYLWTVDNSAGNRGPESEPLKAFLTKYFSKRSASNPLYWSSFIALACPWPWKVSWWLRIWKGALIDIVKAFIRSLRNSVKVIKHQRM